MFVIYRARGWSKNLRNEITKKARYYFVDNGVRNAVIGNFAPLETRDDVGALWEKFCIHGAPKAIYDPRPSLRFILFLAHTYGCGSGYRS